MDSKPENVDGSPKSLDTFAVVELMGHIRMVGRFEQVEMLGAKLGRIEPLQGDGSLGLPSFFGSQSLFRLTIVPEEEARKQTAERRLLTPVRVERSCEDCGIPLAAGNPGPLCRDCFHDHGGDGDGIDDSDGDDEDDELGYRDEDFDDDDDPGEPDDLPEVQAQLDEERAQGQQVYEPVPGHEDDGVPW